MWNYRLLQEDEDGTTVLNLVEVYYSAGGVPEGYCNVSPCGFEDKRQIENALGLMEGALFKPVLYIDEDGKLKEKTNG